MKTEEAVVSNMSTLTEEGVMAVKNAACEKLLDQRVEEKMKSRRVSDHLNRFHVAMPKLRDDKERFPCTPQVVMEAGEKRKTEKDLKDENGGAGVYSASLKKKYILADESWKDDIIPEICDGHNVADFMDPDILNRLEELTSEEDRRKVEDDEEDEFEIEGEKLTEEQKKQLADIRKKKALLIQEHRLKKSNAQNRAAVPRKFNKDKKFTRERLGRDLSSLGLDPSSAMKRARSKSRGRKRERCDDVNDEQQSNKKLCLSRSRSVSRYPHEVLAGEGFKDSSQKIKALKIGNKSHRKRNKDARRGEADRVIPTLKPKYLFSGHMHISPSIVLFGLVICKLHRLANCAAKVLARSVGQRHTTSPLSGPPVSTGPGGMAHQLPKRILQEGADTQIDKINNTCRRTLLNAVKVALKDEYEEILKDPVFEPLLAIIENNLIYSGKIIYSFMCKQLRVSKLHELWFLFAKKPLRFSMKEFYVVTGLKYKEEPDVDFINWKNDKGFWSNALKISAKINLYTIRDELLKVCNEWSYVDRVRLVYLSIIQSFLMAKDWKVYIPQEYIRLVMDFEKLRMYPWGLRAYDELIASIFRAREDVHTKNSYVLDGFSYVFQIWIMEAIPDIGSMREVFTFVSSTGDFDVIDNTRFLREDEKKDERVGRIVELINAKQDWTHFDWEVESLPAYMDLSDSEQDEPADVAEELSVVAEEPTVIAGEPAVAAKRGECKLIDHGAESRKKQLLCQRAAEHNSGVPSEMKTFIEEEPTVIVGEPAVAAKRGERKLIDPGAESRKKQLLCQRAAKHNSGVPSEMKTFIEGLFTASFNSFKEVVQKDIHERFDNVANEVAQLKEQVSQIKGLSDTVGKGNASEILSPSATLGKDQGPSSHSTGPPAAKGKGKASANVDSRPVREDVQTDENEMIDFLKNLTKSSRCVDKGTQDTLQEAMGNFCQASHVKGFDPSQHLDGDEPADFATPLSSFKLADWRPPILKDVDSHEDRIHDPDYSLVFVPEELWAKLVDWTKTFKNWKGSGKVSYQDITSLESHFDKGEVFTFISSTGDFDVIDNTEFLREDEKRDERVGCIVELINAKQDWTHFDWEVESLPAHMDLPDSEQDEPADVAEEPSVVAKEPTVVAGEPTVAAKRGKRKLIDPGAESRKKQLLCQRAAEHNSGVPSEMKTFIEGLFTASFNSFKEVVQKDIHERFDNVANEVAQLKEQVSQIKGLSDTVGKGNASEIMSPSATLEKDQGPSSHSTGPPAAKGKGKASANVDPLLVRRSPRPVREGTQESLQEAMGNLSQASHVKGFDPSQHLDGDEPSDFATPLSSFKPADWRPPTVKDVDSHEDLIHDPDYSLVFVPEELWAKLVDWTKTFKELKIGPSMLTNELVSRVVGPSEWLLNKPADWRPPTLKDVDSHEDRIHDPDYSLVFVPEELWAKLVDWTKTFKELKIGPSMLINELVSRVVGPSKWLLNKKEKKKYKVTGLLQQYGIGELLAHGRTKLIWDLDVNRMYVLLNVGNHWISMCVNFVTRSIEIFDCEGLRHPSAVEPFAVLIPRIVKAVQSSKSQQYHVKQYTVSYASMPFLLNKSSSDCGVYALKHIECHLLGLDFSLVNDNNIHEARQKIAYDLWEAAIDHVLIERMAKFTPPMTISSALVELE
ncbi:hypothetical protein F2Q69_00026257 [Brassica cretica]|uniref:Ubiquitin-like protease family profile domain-containing protein n=1 Tax=Brassica cretica TaxID=69181 RepID=A0A8S9SCP5_BRACR|nr:hypothetical protein F2Q69_00026257 [Brassica cretica]